MLTRPTTMQAVYQAAKGRLIAIGLLAMLAMVSAATAAEPRPEISQVFPDFSVASPRILMGENFEPGKTTVLCWSPPDVTDAQQLLGAVSDDETPLPEQPPSDARQVEVLDVERQIIVARPAAGVAWVKTGGGVSQPYAVDLARPCWLNPEQTQPKQIVHLFGFGLRAPYRETRIALRGGGKTLAARRQHESRAYRDAGPAVFVEVPADAAPGKYTVFVHNGLGGTLGWRRAGQIEVLAPKRVEQRLFSVQDYGAKGDDEANDFEAIAKALAAAQAAVADGVQPVLYFPPGKWRTDTTLQVPAGVWLRGSSRDLTTIEGCGDTGPYGHPTAIVHLASRTRIEEVTVKGMTWKGPEAYWPAMICSPPPVEDVTAQSIRVYAGDYRASQPNFAYWAGGFSINGRFIRLLDSEVFGTCGLGGYRAECINNTIHGGGSHDSVSFSAGGLIEAIIDCNRLVDAPTRFMVSPLRHCLIRFNEVHASHRGNRVYHLDEQGERSTPLPDQDVSRDVPGS